METNPRTATLAAKITALGFRTVVKESPATHSIMIYVFSATEPVWANSPLLATLYFYQGKADGGFYPERGRIGGFSRIHSKTHKGIVAGLAAYAG